MPALILKKGMSLTGNIEDYPEGIIIPIDKPYRWTSADVIRKVKWAAGHHFSKKNLKVGHAGTLDPLATGVLLVCVGKATKLAETLQKHDKQYLAGVIFGATTPSYDREKEIDRYYPVDGVSEESLSAVLPSFIGTQEQVAPLFSAKSVDGVRAYEMARKAYRQSQKDGSDFDHAGAELLSRQIVTISQMNLEEYSADSAGYGIPEPQGWVNPNIKVTDASSLGLPSAKITVGCTKGTYVRALARDLGEALGSGAFLGSLRRTRTGGFCVEESLTVSEALGILGAAERQERRSEQ